MQLVIEYNQMYLNYLYCYTALTLLASQYVTLYQHRFTFKTLKVKLKYTLIHHCFVCQT